MSETTGQLPTCPIACTLLALPRPILAGIAGLAVWEVFARLIAPLWVGFALDPTALIEMAFGISGLPAMALHLLTGLVVFPAGYILAVRPLADRLALAMPDFFSAWPMLSWPVLGLGYGVVLWVLAMYGMASLLGGAPPFLGFQPVAWASLVGHVAVGLVIAAVARGRAGRP